MRVLALAAVLAAVVATLFCSPSPARADEKLAGIACRSVHLGYPAAEGAAFYNELTVEQSAPGTYFVACGFNMGYFGIQELANGKKVVLFSVWDPGQQNDPKQVAADRQVKVRYHDPAVRVGRFGNEGTGAQSFFDYDWKIGETCRFLVQAQPDGERTAYSAWFAAGEQKAGDQKADQQQAWKHLATFSTLASGKQVRGYYSFVEDFRRNRESTKHVRSAAFGNGWTLVDGAWQALAKARFTADSNPAKNIDAFAKDNRFVLATGGDTQNAGTALNATFERRPAGAPAEAPPAGLPERPKLEQLTGG